MDTTRIDTKDISIVIIDITIDSNTVRLSNVRENRISQKNVSYRKRRSVEHDGEDHWVGWERIEELYKRAVRLDEEEDTNAYALYFVTLFETGGRISEVLTLAPKQFVWNEEYILIRRMEVLKRRKRFTRNVAIKIEGDPLAPILIDFVEDCKTTYLLPGYGHVRFGREIVPNSHISKYPVYTKIIAIDPDIWPHWLRDQRSWQLSAKPEEGGRGFDAYLLKAWFEWARIDMATHYAGRREEKDILAALGLKEVL